MGVLHIRQVICLGSLVALAVLFASPVAAQNIFGVSPGNVYFKDVLRGGYAERYITITLDSEVGIPIGFEAWGDIASWFNYSEQILVSRDAPGRLLLQVLPPEDIPNGNYTGYLRVTTEPLAGEFGGEGSAASVVRAVVDVTIKVEITDLEIFACNAGGYSVTSVEQGDETLFEVDITNNGNIRFRPEFQATIWDQEQVSIVDEISLRGDTLLPTQTQRMQFSVPTGEYDIDQYWVDVRVPDCFSEDLLTFDVLEPGALKADGVITSMHSVVWANVDDTIPIFVEFDNIGEKIITARFEGQIQRDGAIVQLLNSEPTQVPVGQHTNFTFYFTPRTAGQYIASGRVFYDAKRTFPSSTVINVQSSGFSWGSIGTFLVYALIITFIAFILYKINTEKRRYRKKTRGV